MPPTILNLAGSNKIAKPYLAGAYGRGGSTTFALSPAGTVVVSATDESAVGVTFVRYRELDARKNKNCRRSRSAAATSCVSAISVPEHSRRHRLSRSAAATRSCNGPITSSARTDYIGGFGTTLAENIGALGTTLCENETTLSKKGPITSVLYDPLAQQASRSSARSPRRHLRADRRELPATVPQEGQHPRKRQVTKVGGQHETAAKGSIRNRRFQGERAISERADNGHWW